MLNYREEISKEELLEKVIDPGIKEVCLKLWNNGFETQSSCSGLIEDHERKIDAWGCAYVTVYIKDTASLLLFLKMKLYFKKKIKLFWGNRFFGYYVFDMNALTRSLPAQLFELSEDYLASLDKKIKESLEEFASKI